ncbi:MAG: type I glutamate--ammonia ligase [Candidatus Marinimicrobia bacterium]|nr:type I glutamate--ammonia ligase [Candidatus Neomarinimicrobiota bacterium]
MFENVEEAERFIKKEDVDFIDLKFVDLIGGLHHLTVPANRIDRKFCENGVGFDSSSVPGFKSVEAGDMVLLPDLETGFMDPFYDDKTLSFLCKIHDANDREPYIRCPRNIALKAEKYMQSTGIADQSKWGPELEYYLFDEADFSQKPLLSFYRINTDQVSDGICDEKSTGYKLNGTSGYHANPPHDTLADIRNETAKIMEKCNIPVKYHHHEVGIYGQVEIEIEFGNPVEMGDAVILGKYIAKMVARRHGKTATFMPKPIYGQAGTGMHFHQHLFKDGEPLFYDENGYAGLSDLALSYTAGLLKFAPEISALTNPSINSFKRLVPGYEAPVSLFFGLANRSSAVRIPKYANQADTKRIEFRPPDGTCNPYLAISAMLLSGLKGIEKELDIEEEGFGPYDQNLFAEENKDILESIQSLPESLSKALAKLGKKNYFLTENNVFTKDIIKTWIKYKRENEIEPMKNYPTPYEFKLYYNS